VNLAAVETVNVELDAAELGGRRTVGTLRRTISGAGSIIGFAYAEGWLAEPGRFALDPLHGLFAGDQWPPNGGTFPIFSDVAPDRWGRMLMDRQEAVLARQAGRPRRRLDEWTYLLGVSDVARMGALRFVAEDGTYLAHTSGVPPITRLPALVAAARGVERPSRSDAAEARDLAVLLAPGSSLGGARPKASFVDEQGRLWMAKFPSRADTRDVGACEWVLNELAQAAGLDVPEHRLLELGSGHRTFAARRFDRLGDSRRLYASAMTMTSHNDRQSASYLDIALAIADHAAPGSVDALLRDLFRRAAFNIVVAHRDDHLRNHGFLRTAAGWQLAPMFDLNPVPEKPEHELAIDDANHAGDLALLIDTAPFYRLTVSAAGRLVDEIRSALRGWRAIAASAHLGDLEMATLEEALDRAS
jgi:serine/threonine-protein kinase HipA